MLSIRKLSLTGVFLLLLIAGCNKDIAPIESGSDVNTLVKLNWNQTEKQFFNFFNQSKVAKNDQKLTFRSGLTNVPPLLAEAYNQIARENDLHQFVDDLTRKIGIPFWLNAYVNMENLEGDGMVIIPFGFEEGKRVEALLVGIKSPELPHNYFHFEFVLRRDIDQMVRQNMVPDNRPNLFLELAHYIYDDARIYQRMDGNLKNYIDHNIDLIDQIDGENIAGLRSCRYIRMLHCLSDGSTTYLDEWYNQNGGSDSGEGPSNPWTPYWGFDLGDLITTTMGGGDPDDPGDGGIEDGNSGNNWGWWWKEWWKRKKRKGKYSDNTDVQCSVSKTNNSIIPKVSPKNPNIFTGGDHYRNNSDCVIYYQKYCDNGNGVWFQVSLKEMDVCHQAMDNFLYQYNLNLDSEMIDFLMSQMNQGLCYNQEAFNCQMNKLLFFAREDIKEIIGNNLLKDPCNPEISSQEIITNSFNNNCEYDFGLKSLTQILSDIIQGHDWIVEDPNSFTQQKCPILVCLYNKMLQQNINFVCSYVAPTFDSDKFKLTIKVQDTEDGSTAYATYNHSTKSATLVFDPLNCDKEDEVSLMSTILHEFVHVELMRKMSEKGYNFNNFSNWKYFYPNLADYFENLAKANSDPSEIHHYLMLSYENIIDKQAKALFEIFKGQSNGLTKQHFYLVAAGGLFYAMEQHNSSVPGFNTLYGEFINKYEPLYNILKTKNLSIGCN